MQLLLRSQQTVVIVSGFGAVLPLIFRSVLPSTPFVEELVGY